MLESAICKFAGHAINRRRVWHDMVDFRAHCARCGSAMLRDREGWRPFDPEDDTDPRRLHSRRQSLYWRLLHN